ncbi:hypothetical protein [Bradyrhizobium oligotrophicum]|uniref:hypothetical protein n=1 Tax=Bradyrhizobium oligotrophicum TaxID=44255 RepID=UPI00118178A0|nr:hypothetical protein [Bradyrhizobium oligotrophicum]
MTLTLIRRGSAVIASVSEAIQSPARDSGLLRFARNDGGETSVLLEQHSGSILSESGVRADIGEGRVLRMGARLRVQELHALISRHRHGTRKP